MAHFSLRYASLLAAAVAFYVSSALAEPPSPVEEAAAAALFKQGLIARDEGRTDAALSALYRAHALAASPRPGLEAARILIGRGELLQAQELLRQVVKLPDYRETAKTKAAREEAAQLAHELEGRIGTIRIFVDGSLDDAKVLLNGREFRRILLGTPWRVNPGNHLIEVRRGAQVIARQQVAVAAGATIDVRVTAPSAATPSASPATPLPPAAQPEVESTAAQTSTSPLRVIGWTVGGVGLAGLGVGLGLGIAAMGKSTESKALCPSETICTNQRGVDLRHEATTLGNTSTVVIVASSIAVAAGAVLVLTAPSGRAHSSGGTSVHLMITASGVSLGGRF